MWLARAHDRGPDRCLGVLIPRQALLGRSRHSQDPTQGGRGSLPTPNVS